jgi:hypothetical protein
MSYNTDLQTNNTNLQSILDTINNLPEAGSGGGSDASVDTCTVRFEDLTMCDCIIWFVSAMTVENGIQKMYNYIPSNSDMITSLVIPNVACGSTLVLESQFHNGTDAAYVEIDGSATFDSSVLASNYAGGLWFLTFTAPQTANEICTIYYAYEA